MKQTKKDLWFAVMVIVWALALLVIGRMEHEDNEGEQTRYCEMVSLYRATDGEFGWPDYEGRECDG